jgi:hypothetical protein
MIRKIAGAAQELGESGVAATVKLAKSLALQWLRAWILRVDRNAPDPIEPRPQRRLGRSNR